MKKIPQSVLLAVLLGLSGPAQAIESIGWSYGRSGRTDDALTPEQVAGAPSYEQSNWNNHISVTSQGIGVLPLSLKDNSGNETTAVLSEWAITYENGWSTYAPGSYSGDDPDEKLMNSYTAENPVLTFSQIPQSYRDNGYSVVVYYRGGGAKTLALSGTEDDLYSQSFSASSNQYKDVGYIEWAPDATNPTNTNYTVIRGLDDPGFTISGRGFFAIQIVKEEGPPSAPSTPNPDPAQFHAVAISNNLTWEPSLRATSYEIYLWKSDEPEPDEPTDETLTNSYDPPSDFDVLSTYSWRVVAKGAGGETPGDVWTFYTGDGGAPQAPFLLLPFSGETAASVNDLVFVWLPSDSAQTYRIYVWPTSESRPSQPTWEGADTAYIFTETLSPATSYNWEVVAMNDVGVTDSGPSTFTTEDFTPSGRDSIGWNHDGRYDGMGAANELAASDGAGAPGFGQKNWNNHVRTSQAQPTTGFPFPLVDSAGNPTTAQLSAWTSDGNSWRMGYVSETPDDKLMKTYVAKQPSLTFSGIPEAYRQSGYSVVVYYANLDSANESILTVSGNVDDNQSRLIQAGPTVSYQTSGFVEETGDYTGPSNYSVFSGFNDPAITISLTNNNGNGITAIQLVREEGAPNVPTGPFPANEAEEVSIDLPLAWSPSLRAETYKLYLWESSDSQPETPTAIVSTPSYDPNLAYSTEYHWQVVAVNDDGEAASPIWSFTTGANVAPEQASNPSPEDASVGVALMPTFDWDEAARASSYELFLWRSTESAPLEATTISTLPGYTPAVPLDAATEYVWRVDTVNSGHRTTGVEWSFTTGEPPTIVTGPAPASGATVNRIYGSLSWNPSPDAVSYRVYLWQADESAPNDPIATTTGTVYTQTVVLEPETTYSWRVDGVNAFGITTGTTWSFTTSTTTSNRQSIGWSYDRRPIGNDQLTADELAGAPSFAQANWNNHTTSADTTIGQGGQGKGDMPFDLVDSSGVPTTAQVTEWTASTPMHGWSRSLAPTTPNGKLMNSYAANETVITFSGMPEDYVAEGYSVVVYYGNLNNNANKTITVNGNVSGLQSRKVNAAGWNAQPFENVGFREGTAENAEASPTVFTNYTVFQDMHDVEIAVGTGTGTSSIGIIAIQFIKNSGGPVGSDYDTWALENDLEGADAAFDADPDNDGISNGIEFVIGGQPNPALPGSNSSGLLIPVQTDGANLIFTFTRTHASASLNPVVEYSQTLDGNWTEAVDGVNATVSVTPGAESDTVTVTIPKNGAEKLFARLRVSSGEPLD